MARLIILALAIFLPMFYIGILTGRAASPDYHSEAASLAFLISNIKVEKISKDEISAELDAGFHHYRYTWPQDVLTERPIMSAIDKDYKPPKRWSNFEYEKADKIIGISSAITSGASAVIVAAGGTAAVAGAGKDGISQIIGLVKAESAAVKRWDSKVAMLIGGALGGAIGFYIGYDDRRDYNANQFKNVVEDKRYWRSIIIPEKICSSFVSSSKNNDASTRVGKIITAGEQKVRSSCEKLDREIA